MRVVRHLARKIVIHDQIYIGKIKPTCRDGRRDKNSKLVVFEFVDCIFSLPLSQLPMKRASLEVVILQKLRHVVSHYSPRNEDLTHDKFGVRSNFMPNDINAGENHSPIGIQKMQVIQIVNIMFPFHRKGHATCSLTISV